MIGEKRDSEAIFPKWILSRAKCFVRLGRDREALALLLAHRDMYNAKAPVNQYLEEVRAGLLALRLYFQVSERRQLPMPPAGR